VTLGRCLLAAALLALIAACGVRDPVAQAAGIASFKRPVAGTCGGTLAQRVFGKALCGCGGFSLGGELTTDGFDSRLGPYASPGRGGDVGTAGGFDAASALTVGGDLTVAGGGFAGGATLDVAGDLAVAAGLGRPGTAAAVGGSARIGGTMDVASLRVGGTLTTPADPSAASSITASGGTVIAPVSVASPCPCDATQAVDVAALVAQYQASNDDAAVGLSPATFDNLNVSTTIPLPDGRFYVNQIQSSADVTLEVSGRTALFVRYRVQAGGTFAIRLDPGAELDLFVGGDLTLPGTVVLGDPARPSALRIWLGRGSVNIGPSAQIAANFYAPASSFSITGPLELYGALMVAAVNHSGTLAIHRDVAIAATSDCSQ
jgi:hypothetical protein